MTQKTVNVDEHLSAELLVHYEAQTYWMARRGYTGSLIACPHCHRWAPHNHKKWWGRSAHCADEDNCKAMQSFAMLVANG